MKIHNLLTRDLVTGQRSGDSPCVQLQASAGSSPQGAVQEAGRPFTKPGSAHFISLREALLRLREINTHLGAGRPLPGARLEGRCPHLPPGDLGTGVVEGPSTSQAAGRVTVFNEEVPQMGSGRPGGGGQAARRIPEGHDGQASEAMM